MGVLGGQSPPNTPIFLPHSGDSQTVIKCVQRHAGAGPASRGGRTGWLIKAREEEQWDQDENTILTCR